MIPLESLRYIPKISCYANHGQQTGDGHYPLSLVSLPVCAGRADKVSTKVKKAREEQTSASFDVSLPLSLPVQSCKNKPNAAFNHFYSREDVKRLRSKIRKTSSSGKKKIHTYSHKMSAGVKQGTLWDIMKSVSHLWALACENLMIFGWNRPCF